MKNKMQGIGITNKIIIFICYYGEFPWYFSYFLHSCKFNSTVDFLIFSDIKFLLQLPPNVRIIDKSIHELKIIASKKLGFDVNFDHSYKLCDFKPAYGLIFEDYCHGYDFWGQSDIDIIYGSIRNFMTDEFLRNYDFISVRHDYTTGCFALYRNTDLIRNIFRRSKDYKTVFSNSQHYCFDECNFVWSELAEGKSILDIETEIESFTHVIKKAEKNNEIRAHFDFILIEGLVGKIRFDNGKIVYKNTYEGILYHLYLFKCVYFPRKIPKRIPNAYRISPSKIYTK